MAQHQRLRAAPTVVGLAAEIVLGLCFLGLSGLGAVLFVHRPWPNRFDAAGFTLLPADPSSRLGHDLASLGSVWALIIGVVVAAVLTIGRDRARTAALVVAPVIAVVVTERIAKPLVGRELTTGGGWSYPSGTVTAVAALAMALCLCVPPRARPFAAVPLAAVILAVCAAVVRMRWHYPTDAAGGIGVGVGTVLLLDGLAHLPVLLRSGRAPATRTRAQGVPISSS
jgi:membrane-associated phospholipid phosphatase